MENLLCLEPKVVLHPPFFPVITLYNKHTPLTFPSILLKNESTHPIFEVPELKVPIQNIKPTLQSFSPTQKISSSLQTPTTTNQNSSLSNPQNLKPLTTSFASSLDERRNPRRIQSKKEIF
jgi:hypothetical protein